MPKKQAANEPTPQHDLSLLARVFVDYRRGLDTDFGACREIVAIFNAQGIDIKAMETSEILATWPNEFGYTTSSTSSVDNDAPDDFSLGDIDPTPVDDSTDESGE